MGIVQSGGQGRAAAPKLFFLSISWHEGIPWLRDDLRRKQTKIEIFDFLWV